MMRMTVREARQRIVQLTEDIDKKDLDLARALATRQWNLVRGYTEELEDMELLRRKIGDAVSEYEENEIDVEYEVMR